MEDVAADVCGRNRKIPAGLWKKTSDDRDAAMERCGKKTGRNPKADAGIGEDALVLPARRGAGAQPRAECLPQENKTKQ